MSIKTPLARAKHLGSAKMGTSDHVHQRVTAVFMIPLLIWFVITVVLFLQKPANEIPYLITSPITIIGSILFILNAFYHASLGLKMIIEDYVNGHYLKIASLLLMYAIVITTIVAGLVAVLSIYILVRTN